MVDTNVWDFYEYDIAGDTMHFISEGSDKAEIQIRKAGETSIEIGIFLGDKHRWFPLTEDATYALADFLNGTPLNGEYVIGVSADEEDDEDETDDSYYPSGYDPRAY